MGDGDGLITVSGAICAFAAAPLGAIAAKRFAPKHMLILVGVVLTLTSAYGIYKAWG